MLINAENDPEIDLCNVKIEDSNRQVYKCID